MDEYIAEIITYFTPIIHVSMKYENGSYNNYLHITFRDKYLCVNSRFYHNIGVLMYFELLINYGTAAILRHFFDTIPFEVRYLCNFNILQIDGENLYVDRIDRKKIMETLQNFGYRKNRDNEIIFSKTPGVVPRIIWSAYHAEYGISETLKTPPSINITKIFPVETLWKS